MFEVTAEIAIVFILILLNSVFALSEIAIISSRRIRLEQQAQNGSKGAEAALDLANNPDQFLSTVQVGITLVGIFAGAFSGATLAQQFTPVLLPLVGEPLATTLSLIIVVGSITYFSVVVGELVPKQIALKNADRIAIWVARPMKTLAWLATPIVRLLTASTNAVIRLLGISPDLSAIVTEEEIRGLVEQGALAGIIEEAEREMVEGVFRLGDYRLEAVLTPRPEIVWLDINDSSEKIRATLEGADSSRFPVCAGDLDNVIGVVRAKSLLTPLLKGENLDLKAAMIEPIFLPENMPAIRAIETFKQTGTHMAMIVDEYGSVEGLVTLYDIMEAIVGDIPTPDEIEDPRIIERENGSWLVDGLIQIQDFMEFFEISDMPHFDDYQTLGGFVVTMIGDLPMTGQRFEWGDYKFEVVDMDIKRVDKILVTKKDKRQETGDQG